MCRSAASYSRSNLSEEGVTSRSQANPVLEQLLAHANSQEVHRELGCTAQAARDPGLVGKAIGLATSAALPVVALSL
jgi:hypothetical protein